MAHLEGETALGLLCRLRPGPAVEGLEPALFPDGLRPKEVVEIHGEHSTGKTLVLMRLIEECIVPRETPSTGSISDVIFVNTDHHFDVRRLAGSLRSRLSESRGRTEGRVEREVREALSRLWVLDCHTSDALFLSFHSIRRMLLRNRDVGLILVDSISAFYWQDTLGGGPRRMDSYLHNVLNVLALFISNFEVRVVFTRPSYFQSRGPSALSPLLDHRNVNTRIHLKLDARHDIQTYSAEVRTLNSLHKRYFTVNERGIEWV